MAQTMRRETTMALISAAATLAVALSGCSSDGSADSAAKSATTSATTSDSTSDSPRTGAATPTNAPADIGPGPDSDLATTAFAVGLDRALAVAAKTAPGATVTKIELDFDRTANAWAWKVDSQQNTDQHEIEIDATTARVLADARDQESADPMPVDPTKLTPKDAMARATTLVPGSVAKWALEYDDGVQRYALDVRTSGAGTQGVLVDVDTGAVRKK